MSDTADPQETSLKVSALTYRAMVGTGGIGWGRFFQLEGNETLGREESRSGRFLDRRDYCKLHIVSHYTRRLLGKRFSVFPIGKVGDDEAGGRLLAEMQEEGLDLRHVGREAGSPTLYSFCFSYPDGTGGNLTTANSASGLVRREAVTAAEPLFRELGLAGIALAAPEVPLEARREVLRLGERYGLFRAASFTREEMPEACASGLLTMTDHLAVNLEEAAAAAGLSVVVARTAGSLDVTELVEVAIREISRSFPHLTLSITAGAAGSWSWDGHEAHHEPALPVPVAGTAGAGDAHLAGILAGLAAGLPLREAHVLGVLVSSVSVTSPHTIHRELDRRLLADRARSARAVPAAVRALLGE